MEENQEVKEVKKVKKGKKNFKTNAELKAELKEMKIKLKELTDAEASIKQVVDVGNGKETAEINFFTEIDYNSKGQLKSVYPFYHNTKVMDDARESLRRMEKSVERGDVPAQYMPETMSMIKNTKDMLEAYESHLPSLERNIDMVVSVRNKLVELIAPTLFTRREMTLGLVDPHEEAKRMAEPIIEVPKELRGIAVKNGVMLDKRGKASRNDLSRLYQMCQRKLGEPGDVEYLRKD